MAIRAKPTLTPVPYRPGVLPGGLASGCRGQAVACPARVRMLVTGGDRTRCHQALEIPGRPPADMTTRSWSLLMVPGRLDGEENVQHQ